MWDLRTTTGFQPDFEQQPRLGSFWTGRGTFLRQFSIWDDPFYGLSHLFHGRMVRNMRNHPSDQGFSLAFFEAKELFDGGGAHCRLVKYPGQNGDTHGIPWLRTTQN